MTRGEIIERFVAQGIADPKRGFVLLLWYGLLGIADDTGDSYIYDYDYNIKRLNAELAQSDPDNVLYAINPVIRCGPMTEWGRISLRSTRAADAMESIDRATIPNGRAD